VFSIPMIDEYSLERAGGFAPRAVSVARERPPSGGTNLYTVETEKVVYPCSRDIW